MLNGKPAGHEKAINGADIFARHLGEVVIGKGGIEQIALAIDALAQRACEGLLAPGADSGLHIRRDIGRINHAKGRFQRPPAGQGLAARFGVADGAIAESRQLLAARHFGRRQRARRRGERRQFGVRAGPNQYAPRAQRDDRDGGKNPGQHAHHNSPRHGTRPRLKPRAKGRAQAAFFRPRSASRLRQPHGARTIGARMTSQSREYVGRRPGARIGLLGGSFNPAHAGHLQISRDALKRLRLDRVWWLVAPHNPLKRQADLAPYDQRLAGARSLAKDPRMRASDLERRWGTYYTADTLALLARRHRGTRFVWLMGADSFAELHRWHAWPRVLRRIVIAVFARSPYDFTALAGKAAHRFRRARRKLGQARAMAGYAPPAWVFLPLRRHPASASAIRAAAKKKRRAK
jgi:nicotinate-nucleotide adenylyltransferase